MKNFTTTPPSLPIATAPTVAIPLNSAETAPLQAATTIPTDRHMLLIRLSEAATRIRQESDLIRRSTFADQTSRLLRILGEMVEEQRGALAGENK